MSSLRLGGIALATVVASFAWAEVSASPSMVTITAADQKVTINLTSGGKAVDAGSIKGYTFNVDDHTYEFMITFAKQNGGVVISPSKQAEVGIYDLTIKTSNGDAHVTVDMPLSDLPDSLENRAKAMGITVDQLQERLGVTKQVGREKVTFSAPGPYYVGTQFTIQTPCPADRQYEWRVNGMVVKQGTGPEPFVYTFPAAGSYVLEYRDLKDGTPIGSGRTTIMVAPKPAGSV